MSGCLFCTFAVCSGLHADVSSGDFIGITTFVLVSVLVSVFVTHTDSMNSMTSPNELVKSLAYVFFFYSV